MAKPNTWGRRFGKRDHNNKEDELRIISHTHYDFVESHKLHLNVGTLKQLNMVVFEQFNASHLELCFFFFCPLHYTWQFLCIMTLCSAMNIKSWCFISSQFWYYLFMHHYKCFYTLSLKNIRKCNIFKKRKKNMESYFFFSANCGFPANFFSSFRE